MKRLEVKNNENPNFIGNWDIENNELCSQIINFFEDNADLQIKGTTAGGVDENVKKSTDITIRPEKLKEKKYEIFNKYFENLYQCFTDYKEQYDFLKTFVKKVHIGPFNIQRYIPGGHFARLHAERTDACCDCVSVVLAKQNLIFIFFLCFLGGVRKTLN